MKHLKIIFSIIFVLVVSFFVVRSCVFKKERARYSTEEKIPETPVLKPLKKSVIKGSSAVETPRTSARMAIVLDDWGQNAPILDDALAIGRPLTIAILPHLKHTHDIAERAYQNHLGIILHMPMQPKKTKDTLEPHTLMVGMPESQAREYLNSAIADIPHLEGVNNHMGSAATADTRLMKIVLSELKKKNLFFLDSNTSGDTVGWKVAKELGILHAKRDVFIDNITKSDEIKKQISKAIQISLSQGQAVVIGHDKKVTLQAIREMIPEIERQGVRLVLVKELVER